MTKHRESGTDRLLKVPLWQWGAILIFAGMISNAVMGLQALPQHAALSRSQAVGRGVATGVFVVSGMGLMLYDVLRPKPVVARKPKKGKVRPE